MAGMDLESGSKASSHGIRIFRVSHDVFMAMNHTRMGFVIYCMFLDLLGSHGTIAESADQSSKDSEHSKLGKEGGRLCFCKKN